MPTKAHILITNDDGVQAPGLLALKQALQPLGDVTVFAPRQSWSASGHTKTMHKPLRIWQVALADGSPAYVTNGAPSDCVSLVVLEAIPFRADLVVSGINRGANLGYDITYSGTVAAALEAAVAGLPGLAVSLDSYEEDADYGPAARMAAGLAAEVLARGLPANTLLNINVPALPASDIKGVRITRLGRRIYRDALVRRADPRGQPYYWIGGEPPLGVEEDGTDVGALASGYVTVTPLEMDMTAHPFVEALKAWNLTLPPLA